MTRNGSLPERELITGVGAIQLRRPRVRDKRPPEEREGSRPFLRETPSSASWLRGFGEWDQVIEP